MNKEKTTPINYKLAPITIIIFFLFASCHVAVRNETKTVSDPIPETGLSHSNTVKLDTAQYNLKMSYLTGDTSIHKWSVKKVYPLPGAILPFKRIVAFYGNFYSPEMGILGEKPTETMLAHLEVEVKKWDQADTAIPVQPALQYIAVTAQSLLGKSNNYRLRMPFSQIDKALELAKQINAIVILDIQVGGSTLQNELPPLEKYLCLPNVHLAIDPEFSMKEGQRPGSEIGTFDANDINYASAYLARIVREHNLPPKVLVVHRFTIKMVTNYRQIILRPEVQLVMNMDGFGFPAKKINTYEECISSEPVQFTGFKLFYKNDVKTPGYNKLMQPADILKLYPRPAYIQYQ